jgi:acetolactate synthase-1/2/3 large subunit
MENGAFVLLESLIRDHEITKCFANPGTSEMHLVSALDRLPIQSFLCLHETVATGASDGYNRMTREAPAISILHLGPGLSNGLSNLHNARRSKSQVLVLVGEMASFHKPFDPVLNMNVLGLASLVSRRVIELKASEQPGSGFVPHFVDSLDDDSRVVTVILPHDAAWGKGNNIQLPLEVFPLIPNLPVKDIAEFCVGLVEALKGKEHVGIYCGGLALGSQIVLDLVARVAAALKRNAPAGKRSVKLLCENAFSRIERGAGRPSFTRMPYFPDAASLEFKKLDCLITVGIHRLPVANFGYESTLISELVTLDESNVWEIDGSESSIVLALEQIVRDIGAVEIECGVNCLGFLSLPSRPSLTGLDLDKPLTPTALCRVLAALQPQDCIIVDESLTSGTTYWPFSEGCPAFSHLTLTGGSIGSGPPLALGASVACPDRLVINLQADGSCLYSLQALWSQARERCNVITVLCDNSSYGILQIEQVKQRLPAAGEAMKALTSLSDPSIDWVALATGMGVKAVKVRTVGELRDQLKELIDTWERSNDIGGPFLIHASLIYT